MFLTAEKINVFIVIEKRQLKLNNSALNSTEKYNNEAKFLKNFNISF